MPWIVVSRRDFDTNDKGELGMVVYLVQIVMFSVEPDLFLFEGNINRNRVFVGI